MLDWKTFRPLHAWIVVRGDPRVKQTKGGIHLPDGQVMAERKMEGTGRILKVGNRDEIRKKLGEDLEPGMRVCYRGFLKDASAREFEPAEDGSPIFMLEVSDVLAVLEDDVQMGVFS